MRPGEHDHRIEITECSYCFVEEPCYFDGEAWVCVDYRKCKENQANG